MTGIAASAIVVAFDATIISTSLPQVVLALGGTDLYAWAGTGYFLASAITILIFGRLGDLYGRKHLMMLSMGLVVLGSVLCGFSQSMEQLIACRVLQGLGGGMMIAITFATASGIGPVLGGAITQALGWLGALFLSNAVGAPLVGVELLSNMGRSAQWLWGLVLLVMGVAATFMLVRIEKMHQQLFFLCGY